MSDEEYYEDEQQQQEEDGYGYDGGEYGGQAEQDYSNQDYEQQNSGNQYDNNQYEGYEESHEAENNDYEQPEDEQNNYYEDGEPQHDDEYGQQEYAHEQHSDNNHVDDYEHDGGDEEFGVESCGTVAAGEDGSASGGGGCDFNMGSLVKGAMDGFGGMGGVMNTIGQIAQGGSISTVLASGGMNNLVEQAFAGAAHRFFGINAETGAIIGAIAGNVIFNMGGKNNSLGGIGKMILENIISGKYKRKVDPFVNPTPGATSFNLNFHNERERCLQQHILFEDPEFPASDRSLYYKTPPTEHIVWKRPGEIVDNPQLIVEGHSRFDVKQGALGDCWLLAACANLTMRDELFYRVVPPDQSFTDNYAGIFHFQFWRYGKWIDVVIDDRLPTVDGRLYYMHSQEHNEFWSALLEKAYAKLYGSYENLEGGTTVEALEDFTGGLTEFFDLRKTPKETALAMLVRGFQMGSLFGCSIQADPAVKEAVQSNGLVRGHAYSITALETVHTHFGDTVLIRIRNPWGNKTEWNGAFSDNSSEWYSVSEEEKQRMHVQFAKDGEFWMAFDDFYHEYEEMEICNLSAEVMNEISEMTGVDATGGNQWDERMQDGWWSRRDGTAGGCANNPDSYASNPQIASFLEITNDSIEQDGKCTVICAVLQKYRREMRVVGMDSLPIGFSVYKVPSEPGYKLDANFFQSHKSVARVPVFINMREVTVRFRVPPGSYVIVPCTFDAGCDGEFLLRIYANGHVQTKPLQ